MDNNEEHHESDEEDDDEERDVLEGGVAEPEGSRSASSADIVRLSFCIILQQDYLLLTHY